MRIELRRALDEVLPPVPWLEATVAQDLRKRRSSRSVDTSASQSHRGTRAFNRPLIQLAATVLVVVLAAAAGAMYLELRNLGPRNAPANRLSIEAYQKMVSRDDGLVIVARNDDCSTLQSACPANGKPMLTAVQYWLDDLNRSEPPARFVVIDARLRLHLAANISDLNAVFAAYYAQDQSALERANQAVTNQQHWLGEVASSIADSQPGTASAYISSVRVADQNFGGCAACLSLVDQVDCAQIESTNCEYGVIYAIRAIQAFEVAPVRVSAPSSLAAQDQRLQNDLAQVDTIVFAMSTAQVTGDQAAFDAGRLSLRPALLAIRGDISGITGA